MDDRRWEPEDPGRYTLVFDSGGQAFLQLDCNRGRSTWTSDTDGQLRFGPVASTNALCDDGQRSERYAAQLEFVRSYLLRDGHLFLATLADGAILEFRPAGPAAPD
jgi:para-nitrobenzyl esterase